MSAYALSARRLSGLAAACVLLACGTVELDPPASAAPLVRCIEARIGTPAERRASMTWAQRLKRVFNIDIETCHACGGALKVIACIEDPVVIQKILTHIDQQEPRQWTGRLPQGRAPSAGLFG